LFVEEFYAQKYAHLFESFFLETPSSFPLPSRTFRPNRTSIFPLWGNGKQEIAFAAENLHEDKWIQPADDWVRRQETESEKIARKKRDWNMFYRRHSSRLEEKPKKFKSELKVSRSPLSSPSMGESILQIEMEKNFSLPLMWIKEKKQKSGRISRKYLKEKEMMKTEETFTFEKESFEKDSSQMDISHQTNDNVSEKEQEYATLSASSTLDSSISTQTVIKLF